MCAPREEHQEDHVHSTSTSTQKEGLPERAPATLMQAARSVKLGQKVTATVVLGRRTEQVTGYLAGADAECWFILQPGEDTVRQLLVNRPGTRVLEIHSEATYDQEPLRKIMDAIVIPFRTWVDRNVLERRS